MTLSTHSVLFSFIVCIGLLISGMGIPFGNQSIYGIVFIVLVIRFIKESIQKKSYLFPKTIIFFFLVFLITSVLSTFFSRDTQESVFVLFQYVVLGLIFIFACTHKELCKNILPNLLLMIGVFLCLYSLFIYSFHVFIPVDGYQLVFSRFGSHNHLGDYLIIPIIICIYNLFTKKRVLSYILLLLFFLLFFFFSYSRSAYISFSVVMIYFLIQSFYSAKKNIYLITFSVLISIIVVVTFLFFFITVFESKYSTTLRPMHQILVENFGLRFKHFGANRIAYAGSAIHSIIERPFVGVGPGNFIYASKRYKILPNYATASSHNIFLDILTENGVLAFFCFVSMIVLVIKASLNDKSVYPLLFFALLLNFQTDYTFRISSMIMLFVLFMGIIYSNTKMQK